MSKWTIYRGNGKVLHESVTNYDGNGKIVEQDTLEYSGKWMGDSFVTVSFKSRREEILKGDLWGRLHL